MDDQSSKESSLASVSNSMAVLQVWKNRNWKLFFSFVYVDFKFVTCSIVILKHIRHQVSSWFYWNFKNTSLAILLMLLDFQEKNGKYVFCEVSWCSFNLKCHPFIGKRSEMLGKEGHGILQFEVALKGKKGILP